MAKGAIAKDNLIKRFITALGEDYVGVDETGKKFYFWSTENGERMQVYVSLTYAKNPLICKASGGDLNFEEVPKIPVKAEMQEDEKATLERLMAELGL